MERIGDTMLFRAGPGEWYNQPHDEVWDMGEDVADIPPASWHLSLQKSLEDETGDASRIVLDLTEMDWLVGQDWGFLYRLVQELSAEGKELAIVANDRIAKSASTLELDKYIKVFSSIDEAMPKTSD